jgi:hypothetical protein
VSNDGALVDVSELEQPEVRHALTALFRSLGLSVEARVAARSKEGGDKDGNAEYRGGEVSKGFGLSEAPERKEEAVLLKRCINLLAATLEAADACCFPAVEAIDSNADTDADAAASAGAAAEAAKAAKAAAASAAASRVPRGPAQGPAMPNPAALAAAAASSAEPYQVLGLGVGASEEEVRGAYKRLARKLHPDRLVRASPQTKAEAETKFEQVKAAHLFLLNTGPSAPDTNGPRGVAEDSDNDSLDDEYDEDGPKPTTLATVRGNGGSSSAGSAGSGVDLKGWGVGGDDGDLPPEDAARKKRIRDAEWELVRQGKSAAEAAAEAAAAEAVCVCFVFFALDAPLPLFPPRPSLPPLPSLPPPLPQQQQITTTSYQHTRMLS